MKQERRWELIDRLLEIYHVFDETVEDMLCGLTSYTAEERDEVFARREQARRRLEMFAQGFSEPLGVDRDKSLSKRREPEGELERLTAEHRASMDADELEAFYASVGAEFPPF